MENSTFYILHSQFKLSAETCQLNVMCPRQDYRPTILPMI